MTTSKIKKRPGRPSNTELKKRRGEESQNHEDNLKRTLRALYGVQCRAKLMYGDSCPVTIFFPIEHIYSAGITGMYPVEKTGKYLLLNEEKGYVERGGLENSGPRNFLRIGFRIRDDKLGEVEKLVNS